MSPEGYLQGRYGPKTDVWAFGIMLFELVHGCVPLIHCRTDEELKVELARPFHRERITAMVSEEYKEVILRCLEF
ncbi:unnamed protein product [Sphagnum balticum]